MGLAGETAHKRLTPLDGNSTYRNWAELAETSIRKVNSRTLEGYRKSQGWANDQRVYFIIEFSQDCEVLAGYKKFSPLENGQKITDKGCYLYVDFGQKTNKILAKISISSALIFWSCLFQAWLASLFTLSKLQWESSV